MTDFCTNPPPGSRIRPQTLASRGADGKEIPIPCNKMQAEHDHFMARAIALARVSMDEGNGPAGCVIVCDGRVLSEGRNLVQTSVDPTAHGEMETIRNAAAILKTTDLSGVTLYTTMEPCPMCGWAILNANISTVVLGARHAGFRSRPLGSYSLEGLVAMTGRKLEIITGVRESECEQLRYAALERMVRQTR